MILFHVPRIDSGDLRLWRRVLLPAHLMRRAGMPVRIVSGAINAADLTGVATIIFAGAATPETAGLCRLARDAGPQVVLDVGDTRSLTAELPSLRPAAAFAHRLIAANAALALLVAERLGLAPAAPGQIEVQVAFKDGKTAGIRIGSSKGEDYHVQSLDSPQIFTVKKWGMEAIAHVPADLGDKSLVSLKADQIDSVTVAQGTDLLVVRAADKTWKADKLADADEGKLKSLAESFDNLSGSGFVPAGAPELASLAKPRATVTVVKKGGPKAGAPLVLKIGDARGDDVVVQRGGAPAGEALWLKKMQVDRFLKKPADVAKDKK